MTARRRAPRVYGALWRLQREIAYRGTALACPVCGHRLARWQNPAGEPWREICPFCLSEARHRSMWLWLPTTDLLSHRQRVLYFAPEELIQAKLRALPNLEYVSADLSSPLADRQVDATDMPFGDNSFDIVFCSHILEHIPDDMRAMRELYRVLAPGGWALILSPYRADRLTDEDPTASIGDRIQRFGQADHVRQYGTDLPDRIRSVGFEVDQEVIAGRFDPTIVRYYGLYPDEVFFVGRKS